MKKNNNKYDFSFTILGCGHSFGVPSANGNWNKCNKKNIKNYRTRCSLLIKYKNKEKKSKSYNIIVDTGPDFRSQCIQNGISTLDLVLYTHYHADHIHGLNDIRSFFLDNKNPISIYCNEETCQEIKKGFSYCFVKKSSYPIMSYIFSTDSNDINTISLLASDNCDEKVCEIHLIPICHGDITAYGILCEGVLYTPDISYMNNYRKIIEEYKVNTWILDGMRFSPHPSHSHIQQSIEWIMSAKNIKRGYLTNLSNEVDYDMLYDYIKKLQINHIHPCYDGLCIGKIT